MKDYMSKIMDELDRTEELLHKSLKEINDKGDLNAASLEVLGETLDGIKDLYQLKGTGMDMIEQYGYSERRSPYYSSRSYGYPGGNSGYSRGGYAHNDYPRYSGADPYMDDLHRRMETAKNDAEREVIRNLIKDYENGR